jgi:hypothetical protein
MPSLEEFLGTPKVENIPERTDQDRMGEAAGESTDVRFCACGCGQKLGVNVHGNVRYLPKHKMANTRLPKDPDRPEKPRDLPSFPGDKLPANVQKDIEEKCEFLLIIFGATWESRDPICGAEFMERTDKIAEKLVPLIAKNAKLLKFFTAESGVSNAIELAIVLAPIATSVVKHHVFKTIGHDEEAMMIPNENVNNLYPVPGQ